MCVLASKANDDHWGGCRGGGGVDGGCSDAKEMEVLRHEKYLRSLKNSATKDVYS